MADDRSLAVWVDKLEIRELIERSVRHVDDQDAAAFADCFGPDGVLQLAGTVFAGQAALREMFGGGGQRPGWTEPGRLLVQPGSMHLTTNPVVAVDGDVAARGDRHDHVGARRRRPCRITLLARYRDRLRRGEDGRWRLSSRTGVSLGVPGEIGTEAEWVRGCWGPCPTTCGGGFRPEG